MSGVPWATSFDDENEQVKNATKISSRANTSTMKDILYNGSGVVDAEPATRSGKRAYGNGGVSESPFAIDESAPSGMPTRAPGVVKKEGAGKVTSQGFDPAVYAANMAAARATNDGGRDRNLRGGGNIISFDE